MSLLISKENLVYMGEQTRTSKTGKEFTLVTIGDPKEMQKHDFFKNNQCNTDNIAEGEFVELTLNLDTQGYNQRISLVEIKPKK